jgi:RTX calcium-binding nonapeptide repeat (4 copies)
VALVAAPGEANDTALRFSSDPLGSSWTVSDSGATLVPGASCEPIDVHTVRCGPPPGGALGVARVELGDLDDRLTVEPSVGPSMFDPPVLAYGGAGGDRLVAAHRADGGPGDDDLVASAISRLRPNFGDSLDGGLGNDRLVGGDGGDRLHGGGGVDELNGAAGNDWLFDDDLDAAVGEGGAGPDGLDGGTGVDTVSYVRRSAPIRVDLADRASGGARGEGDRLTNVESLIGGRGNDHLAGDERPNVIDGHRGRDRLSGRGGTDELRRAEGRVSCGTDGDTFFGGHSWRDFPQPDCEVLAPQAIPSPNPIMRPYPVAVFRRSVRFRIQCPFDEVGDSPSLYLPCGPGRLRLSEAVGGRRLLAKGRLPAGEWGRRGRLVNVRLTALGRRLATRRHGVRARVRLAGYYRDGPALRWSIRLKVPR